MATVAEHDYIEYFMWKHENQMTVREIAEILGIRKETVYTIAKTAGIKVKKRAASKGADCKNRPAACFVCPAMDCKCRENANKQEAEYVSAGKLI